MVGRTLVHGLPVYNPGIEIIAFINQTAGSNGIFLTHLAF